MINGRMIGSHVPAAARDFVNQQRWCVIAAEGPAGTVDASLLTSDPGFLHVSDDLSGLRIALDDPQLVLPATAPFADLQKGRAVALLLIELQTRRRLRINGYVRSTSPDLLDVDVRQSFPACPRYIQKRQPDPDAAVPASAAPSTGFALDAATTDWIAAADTLFIASLGPTGEPDVSHRGGRPGFVRVHGQRLLIPDFSGNSMFTTLGNLAVEPRCGLVLPDFGGTRQLQLTGRASLQFDVPEDLERTGGTGRWIEIQLDTWRITPLNKALPWRLIEASRFNP